MNDELEYDKVKKFLMKYWKDEFDLKLKKMNIEGVL